MAAIAWSWLRGFPLEECAHAGLAAAAICIGSAETISLQLNRESLLKRMELQKQMEASAE